MTDPSLAYRPFGYLGPSGSQSHQATLAFLKRFEPQVPFELRAVSTLSQLMEETEQGILHYSLLPYENALEGSVLEVLETLGQQKRTLNILGECYFPILHCLIQKDLTTPVERVYSHPQALGQCRQTLLKRFGPNLQLISTDSTSQAVHQLASDPNPAGKAAIGTSMAAARQGLSVTATDISDAQDNLTRFVLVSNDKAAMFPSRPSLKASSALLKTAVCVHLKEYPGALMDFLSLFKEAGINLSKLESRPSRKRYGDYYFYLDAEADLKPLRDGGFLRELSEASLFLHAIGPYWALGHLTWENPLAFYDANQPLRATL
jgi:prephenate dehydratase